MYDVTIKAVLNGWSVQVGCQTLVFRDKREMLEELDAYLTNPDVAEKRHREQAVNAKITLPLVSTVSQNNLITSSDHTTTIGYFDARNTSTGV